jgi:hypothetical protein
MSDQGELDHRCGGRLIPSVVWLRLLPSDTGGVFLRGWRCDRCGDELVLSRPQAAFQDGTMQ